MKVSKIVLLVIVGLVSVILTEILAFVWLAFAPRGLDLTGHFYLLTVLPAALVAVIIAALLGWKLFAVGTLPSALVFAGVYIATHAFLMGQLGNPVTVLLTYAVTLAVASAVVLFAFSRLVWSR